MARRNPVARFLGDVDPAHFGDPLDEIGLFRHCLTVADARGALHSEVVAEIDQMLSLVEDADAFDIIELMRMREFPSVPDPRLDWEGSALNVEIIVAMLLGRGSRKPTDTPRLDTRPHEAVTELHNRAQRLGRLSIYRQQCEARLSEDPLAPLAAEYQGAVLHIRNLQYDTIRESHESQLFDNAIVAPLMAEHLGYTYTDVVTVRNSMGRLGGDRMTRLRDDTGAIVMRHSEAPPDQVPEEEMREFVKAMVSFMFLPADRAVITAEDVAADSGTDEEVVRAVLKSYAQTFDDSIPPSRRVYDLLTSSNPFLITPLVSDGAGNYVETTTGVGLDSLRRIVETALSGTKEFHRYDKKVRQVVSERLATSALEKVLRTPPRFIGFTYYAPDDNESHNLLSRDCASLKAVGKPVEGDGLFIVGDVAICVEVKGKSIALAARRGDVRRLWRDLKATIGDGCKQAARLQALIETNAGLWLEDGTWLDLSGIREVRSVVALLDDVGPLGTSLGDHRQTGLLPVERTPWVTSLHDLETIALVCDRPSEFLLYLRRRTDSDVATYYKAADELDLFMLFMNADLYVEPDPDEVRANHPTIGRVTKRDRKERARSAIPTRVGEQCQGLNAWMAREQDQDATDDVQPVKPTYSALPRILELIDVIDDYRDGMIRFGADVLALSGDGQQRLLDTIDTCIRRTRKDGQPHHGMFSLAGAWGHPIVFIGSCPDAIPLEPVRQRLQTYMNLKHHQMKSDRAYGLLFNEAGNLEVVMYYNLPTGEDAELDALVRESGLRPVDGTRPAASPSTRRTTRRLKGKKKRRK
ncbi:hypothetical protein [Lentzea cavernae]|uniref:Preprotein translocase subunit SecA n=1 Tax=Lentzea cavernae TaxID=2020703 RepID=A0ABQ3MFH8_9PSEU|nr:hypothetical protein [Lentzea cavernae]GHH43956.1 hypothetical protein GCM10017774_42530 [Lentzea cavernae]